MVRLAPSDKESPFVGIFFELCLLGIFFFGPILLIDAAPTAWRFPVGGRVLGFPVASQWGKIHFIAEDRFFYTLSLKGKMIHRRYMNEPLADIFTGGSDGTLYTATKKGKLLALNTEGEVLWSFQASGPLRLSPVIRSDGVLFLTDQQGSLYALSHLGHLLWHRKLPEGGLLYFLLSDEGILLLVSPRKILSAFSPAGSLLWEVQLKGKPFPPTLSPKHQSLVVTNEEGEVLILDLKTGKSQNSYEKIPLSSPALLDLQGSLWGVEKKAVVRLGRKGQPLWRIPMAAFHSLALLDDGGVLLGTTTGVFWRVTAKGEKILVAKNLSIEKGWVLTHGILLYGMNDWSLYGYAPTQTRLPDVFRPPHLPPERSALLVQQIETSSFYLTLLPLLEHLELSVKKRALETIERELAEGDSLLKREASLLLLERTLKKEAPLSSRGHHQKLGGHLLLQRKIYQLLGKYGSLISRRKLLEKGRLPQPLELSLPLIEALGTLASDHDGASGAFLQQIFQRHRGQLFPDFVHTVMAAIEKLLAYSGVAGRTTLLDVLTEIAQEKRIPHTTRRYAGSLLKRA